MRKIYILLVLGLFFAGYAVSVQRMETVLADGKTILLPLAPRDPRALLMGDYMDLRYMVNDRIRDALREAKTASGTDAGAEGLAVLRVRHEPVAQAADFVRLDDGSYRVVEQQEAPAWRRGDAVRLQNGGIVAGGAAPAGSAAF